MRAGRGSQAGAGGRGESPAPTHLELSAVDATRRTLRPISDVAAELGMDSQHVIGWGHDRAKVSLAALDKRPPTGRLVLVSAVTPTKAGEGKTTMSIALAMGLRKLGRRPVLALREPSLGPVFGIKGGGTGGGAATIEPADDINLHFTGDIHAVTAAHNLLAALVDNAVHFREPVALDPRLVTWHRAMDMNDRSLRNIVVGLGGRFAGMPRETGFDITAASEVMAVLCLARDLPDLRARLSRIVVGRTRAGQAVRAADLGADGAMTALLRDALMPNLVQTAEGGPALVHGGPFANIAHGANSVIATRMAMAYGSEAITEAGFGFDLGAEKFLDITCRTAGIWPSGVVLVATVRALKTHGGVGYEDLAIPNVPALRRGLGNLARHVESVGQFGLPVVVAVNQHSDDSPAELELIREWCDTAGVPVATCDGFALGGAGSVELAQAVLDMLDKSDADPPIPRHPYELTDAPEKKITRVARRVYGAKSVMFTPQARREIAAIVQTEGDQLPVCIAKTHLSVSDDPRLLGRPEGFEITVREVRLSAGAGFMVALTGDIMTMPGLPRVPAAAGIEVTKEGAVSGLMAHH